MVSTSRRLRSHERESPLGVLLAIGGLAAALTPGLARASNMTHPRTPVVWDGGGGECELPQIETPCMTLHDRSADPVLHLPYGIPYEDLDVTPDEVEQSRTHQFFAFCRPHSPQDFLPSWITAADVDSAVTKGLIDAGTVEPSDIMESSTAWEDCWFRINEDVDRRPIQCSMAEAGIDWDTSAVPAGAYTLDGYTYEPVFNIWVLRPGVVKVHDGDPDAVGPAAAVMTGELTPYRNDTVTIDGCVDAIDGTTFTVSYAVVQEEIEWVEYEAGLAVGGGTFAFEFQPPEELAGESGMIKVDFVDPMDRAYTAYMNENIIVINADNPMGCNSEGGSFIGGPCAEDSGGSEESAGSDDVGDTAGTAGETGDEDATDDGDTLQMDDDGGDPPKGCGCTTDAARPSALLALFGLAAIRRRRR
jgi:MYXO-CTERM domain-containing protein